MAELIVFNLDIAEYVDENGIYVDVGELFWQKYEACVEAMRVSCSDDELFHGFRITELNPDPLLAILVLELLLDDEETLIAISVKYERSSVYFIAWRRGRGEPDPNDKDNKQPWQKCRDFQNYNIPGAVMGTFFGRYGGDDENSNTYLGIGGELGVLSLRQAVTNLWFEDEIVHQKAFLTLCIHIAEPVRYDCVADEFRLVITVNVYDRVQFKQMMKLFIKNWQIVSNAIQDYFENSETEGNHFKIPKERLDHLTIEETREIMGIIKRRKIIHENN